MNTIKSSAKPFGQFALSFVVMSVMFLFAVAPASATPANFASNGFGFNASGLEALPSVSFDMPEQFLLAGAPGTATSLDVELIGSTDICILAAGDNVCQADPSSVVGDFSAIVTLAITVLDNGHATELSGPFTLFLNSLTGTPAYDLANVSVELNPTAPAGLDTSAVPGFSFDGSFTPFVQVQYLATGGSTVLANYIGWTVQDGDTVTFRYDVTGGPVGGIAPQLSANAAPVAVVPEPGTALMMGLGLAGLSWFGGRRR